MQQNKKDDQEIDLSVLLKNGRQIKDYIDDFFYRKILYIKKSIIILLVLFALGLGLSYYLEKEQVTYQHQLRVIQNFDSSDYLYAKIDLLNAKVLENDMEFFKNIGIIDYQKLSKLEIEPIIDIYEFLNRKSESLNTISQLEDQLVADQKNIKFKLFELLADKGNLNTALEDNITSKNYKNHLIKILTNQQINQKEIIEPILNYLNENQYFESVKKSVQESIKLRIQTSEQTIVQIDTLLNNMTLQSNTKQTNKSLYSNEGDQIASIFTAKNALVEELELKKNELLNSDKIIRESSILLNRKILETTRNIGRLSLSFIFIGLFLCGTYLVSFYKRQTAKYDLINKKQEN